MSKQERAELERMRHVLLEDIRRLEEQVSFGEITKADAEARLSRRWGDDYVAALEALEKQLSPSIPLAAFLGLAAVLVIGLAVYLLVASPPTAMVIAGQGEPIIINAQRPLRITEDARITDLTVLAMATGKVTLHLQDATGKHVLATIEDDELECVGCGETYEPPYLLEAEGGSAHLTTLSYMRVG